MDIIWLRKFPGAPMPRVGREPNDLTSAIVLASWLAHCTTLLVSPLSNTNTPDVLYTLARLSAI